MSHKTYAIIYGVLFLLIGLLGFVPMLAPDGHLFNFLLMGTIHNFIYIFIGVIGLLMAFSAYYSRMYFKVVGFVLLFMALLGLMFGSHLDLLPFNIGDNLFNLVMGALALYLGFGKLRT
jgi:hypothetical protein